MTFSANAEVNCAVKVCNRIERLSLKLWSHFKDNAGETCFEVIVPKGKAVVGTVLSSGSRWYQGSFNPTKKSVTKVREVYGCE